jgi:hypothetical protein
VAIWAVNGQVNLATYEDFRTATDSGPEAAQPIFHVYLASDLVEVVERISEFESTKQPRSSWLVGEILQPSRVPAVSREFALVS